MEILLIKISSILEEDSKMMISLAHAKIQFHMGNLLSKLFNLFKISKQFFQLRLRLNKFYSQLSNLEMHLSNNLLSSNLLFSSLLFRMKLDLVKERSNPFPKTRLKLLMIKEKNLLLISEGAQELKLSINPFHRQEMILFGKELEN